MRVWGKGGPCLPLMLTSSTTYPAYGRGGNRISRTYKPTHFDSLITKQEQEVARLEGQLRKAKQDLATPANSLLPSLRTSPLEDERHTSAATVCPGPQVQTAWPRDHCDIPQIVNRDSGLRSPLSGAPPD